MALLLQAFLNANRDPQQRREPIGFEEVMGWLGHDVRPPPPPVQTPEALAATIEVLHGFYSQSQHANGI